jgi:excisionase family DNA binding protein
MALSRTKPKEERDKEFTLPDGMPYTLTIRETARVLGLGINTCYEAARRGDIPSIRIGRRLVVPTQALRGLLDVAAKDARVGEAGDAS